ncbi:MFS transporter [Alicyclobacillus sp. ALC3]|uniref:MFS transporter n=1 Tax=Alicyclobacillus sp. ALC3 TaxID=2796143 RepID=UPI0023785F5A|nr:MFS transporter [Alicyclobacillus sp. ALC3]WDL96797.1 MFS transporter [Alicyclobacillus sp. ALC3]
MTTRRHWGIGMLTILAIGPNLMLSVAVMFMQDLFQNSFATGSYAPMWVVIFGNMAFALFTPIGPFLMRRIGLRSTYVPAMIVFLLGSLICSWSPTIVWLGVGRFLEGMAAGTVFMMMIPALILSFPAVRRNRVLAVLVAGFFGSVAMGPFLGSLTIMEDAWRWLFAAVGLLALAGALMGRNLPNALGPPPIQNGAAAGNHVFDTSGFLITVATCLSLAIALGNLDRWGLWSPQFSIPAIIAVAFLRTFGLGRIVRL